MGKRDWILLLVPIVINGGILYWFQLYISEKIKKNNAKKELIKNIYEDYLVLVNKALKSFRITCTILVNSKGRERQEIDTFNNAVSQLRDDIRELQFYYKDYKYIVGNVEELACKYEVLNEEFLKFNSGKTEDAITFLKVGEALLQDVLEITLKNILKL